MLGWKEFELELMRDKHDNVVVVCSIENLDPMGVHTGDSITVAPAMTLTDREYQHMRDIGIAVLREVGVDTGGCNIQFAIDPADGRMIVIEMNPRVSRSSALASKATGFPIAKIAAKLAVGYTLDEIPNDITRETPAAFEPTLDYVVVKVPRFAFEKFPGADPVLTTHMKSVGEAMAIGRNFTEALGKALRSMETKAAGFWTGADAECRPTRTALRGRGDPDRRPAVHGRAGAARRRDRRRGRRGDRHRPVVRRPDRAARRARRRASRDAPDAHRRRCCARRSGTGCPTGRSPRCVPSSPARTACARCGTGSASGRSSRPSTPARPSSPPRRRTTTRPTTRRPRSRRSRTGAKVIILGSGPNRIGQGIEFDYSCVHAVDGAARRRLRDRDGQLQPGDGLDRLRHRRPALLRAADLRGRARGRARRAGSPGTVRRASSARSAARRRSGWRSGSRTPACRSLGTQPEAIHLAEDRGAFGRVLAEAGLPAPQARHGDLVRRGQGGRRRDRLPGARPAVVRARRPRHGDRLRRRARCADYISRATEITPDHPVLVDRFLDDAIEIDVDALYDGTELYLGGVMEHIEEAGIHSGDSACALPPITLGAGDIDAVRASHAGDRRRASACAGCSTCSTRSPATSSTSSRPTRARQPHRARSCRKATAVPLAKAAARITLGATIAELRAEGMLPRDRRRRRPARRRADRGQGGGAAVPPVPHPGGDRSTRSSARR